MRTNNRLLQDLNNKQKIIDNQGQIKGFNSERKIPRMEIKNKIKQVLYYSILNRIV
jgi:hypothetical protein